MRDSINSRREAVLRDLLSNKKGLVVHCSALTANGKAFAFAGLADIGKTTLAEKLGKKMEVINDDMNIFEFTDKGINVSTYFTQSENRGFHYIINEKAGGILKTVLFPVKEYSLDSFLEPLTDKAFIWTALLTCTAPPLKGEDHLFPAYLELIDRLIDSVPFFKVHHNLKDPPEFLAELLKTVQKKSVD